MKTINQKIQFHKFQSSLSSEFDLSFKFHMKWTTKSMSFQYFNVNILKFNFIVKIFKITNHCAVHDDDIIDEFSGATIITTQKNAFFGMVFLALSLSFSLSFIPCTLFFFLGRCCLLFYCVAVAPIPMYVLCTDFSFFLLFLSRFHSMQTHNAMCVSWNFVCSATV